MDLLRALPAAALLALPTAFPGSAQSMLEAAQQNMQLGLAICLRTGPDGDSARTALNAAGFTYSPEGQAPDIVHWFHGPMGTASVGVVHSDLQMECRIVSDQMGVSDAIAMTGTMLNTLAPGVFEFGNMENTAPVTPGDANQPCTGYVGFAGQRPIVVSIANAGQDPVCVDDGSTQIMVLF